MTSISSDDAGFRVAAGLAVVTENARIETGLKRIISAAAQLADNHRGVPEWVTVTPEHAALLISVWKARSPTDSSPVPATTPHRVNWMAGGT